MFSRFQKTGDIQASFSCKTTCSSWKSNLQSWYDKLLHSWAQLNLQLCGKKYALDAVHYRRNNREAAQSTSRHWWHDNSAELRWQLNSIWIARFCNKERYNQVNHGWMSYANWSTTKGYTLTYYACSIDDYTEYVICIRPLSRA
jgi:hypothetical protein